MRKLFGLLAAVAMLVGTAVPASAATLTLQSGALGVAIGALPPITLPNISSPAVFVSSGGGSFLEPASVFTGFVAIPKDLFTGVDLISSLNVTVANGTKVVTAAGGIAGGFGGTGPLNGSAVVGVLGGLILLGIPLSPVGGGGVVQAGAATLMITVTGHLWTTGAASVTAVSSATPLGGFTNTVTAAGSDNRTAGHAGTILLVSPFRAITNAAGTLTGFATQLLTFVPEPGTLLLLGSGIAGLALVGRKRLKK